jgi:nicotinamidase-related amidase
VPPHFEPERVGEVWRVPYEERASNAAAGRTHTAIGPAADDSAAIALVLVDVQNTFCLPDFELFVARDAVDDSRRICEFVYRKPRRDHADRPTLDTHQATQIFHALWLVDGDGGTRPVHARLGGRRRARRLALQPGGGRALGIEPERGQRHCSTTSRTRAGGKYALTIWPYHAMLGGIGHALVSAVEEAVFFHTSRGRASRASRRRARSRGRSTTRRSGRR